VLQPNNINDQAIHSALRFNAILTILTVHQSQGITVDKSVVDIGSSEFALGLLYVVLSWVRTIEGLLIDPTFSPDRLFKSIN